MVLLLFAGGGLASVQADSITVNARLVLGTSKEKQGSKKVSESIRKRLAKVFKWMHYHQLSSKKLTIDDSKTCLLYTSPSPRDKRQSRMPSSA